MLAISIALLTQLIEAFVHSTDKAGAAGSIILVLMEVEEEEKQAYETN